MTETRSRHVGELAGVVGDAGILTDPGDMASYLVDWRRRHTGTAFAVVKPAATDQVSRVLAYCNDQGIKVFPQGGNTSVCGGSVPGGTEEGIVLSLTRMNRILELNPANDSMIVEAGCVLQSIQEAAAREGRLFPLSLGAEGSCQIGGNLATNAGGTNVLRYGNARDLVLGLEVVLSDGRVWNGLRVLRKNNSGYDLKNLFIGAEGTLGVITAAALKLFPLPRSTVTAMFGTTSAQAAVDQGLRLKMRFSETLTALELISRSELDIALRHACKGDADPVPGRPDWLVLVELSSPDQSMDLSGMLIDFMGEAADAGSVTDGVVASSERERAKLWKLRHSVTESNGREGMGLTYDIAVPVYKIPEFIAAANDALSGRFPHATPVVVGHMGDGNLHYIAMHSHDFWHALADKVRYQETLDTCLYDIADSLGGTFSAEHGIGALHLAQMKKYKPAVEISLMREIKQLFDPRDIMNAGRVLPS